MQCFRLESSGFREPRSSPSSKVAWRGGVELQERFARGDEEAFETLFREHQREVLGWIVKIVRDRAAAEDLTLETFWRIFRAHARFDPRRSFGAWARRIAANVAIEHLSRSRAETPTSVEPHAAAAADPVEREEMLQATRNAFQALPPRFRVAVTLALIEERPYDEIAAVMGTSVGTVKSRVFRGVRRLRRELERKGMKP